MTQPITLTPDEIKLVKALRKARTDEARSEQILAALLTEDEADLLVSLRREQSSTPFGLGVG